MQVRRLNHDQPSLQSHSKVEPYWVWFGTWVERRLERALVWGKTDFGQSIWLAGGQTTAFTILNCLEYEFLNGFLVQGWQQSFWKFSILSNILDLQWCRPNKWKIHSQLSAMFTCRDGKGGKLSSQASKMLYKPPGAIYIASYKEPLDQSDNSLFSSEIILICIILSLLAFVFCLCPLILVRVSPRLHGLTP